MTERYAPRPQYPLLAAFAASSPLLGRGGCGGACAPNGGVIPAYAGMTVKGAGMTVMAGRDGLCIGLRMGLRGAAGAAL